MKSSGLRQFWLRKLHSLAGLLFAGAFLVCHFASPGMNIFDHGQLLKWALLLLPLAFHALYGLYIIYEGKIQLYRFARNWMYILQRLSAMVVFIFLPIHIFVLKYHTEWFDNAAHLALWLGGSIFAAAHLANGIFGVLIHWGMTIGPRSQRAAVVLSGAACLLLLVVSLNTFTEVTEVRTFVGKVYALLF